MNSDALSRLSSSEGFTERLGSRCLPDKQPSTVTRTCCDRNWEGCCAGGSLGGGVGPRSCAYAVSDNTIDRKIALRMFCLASRQQCDPSTRPGLREGLQAGQPEARGPTPSRVALLSEQYVILSSLPDPLVIVHQDPVAPRQQRRALRAGQHTRRRLLHGFSREPAQALQDRTVAAQQLGRLHQVLASTERTRVIDEPQRPIVGPDRVAAVPVLVL